MEEDIKILEEFKETGFHTLFLKYGDRNTTNLRITRALENLIKGYRELKEENTDLKDLYIRTAKHQHKIGHTELGDYMLAQIGAIPTFTTWEKYITWVPKSKIKEKIEELERTRKEISKKNNYTLLKDNPDTPIYDLYGYFLVVLEELMEDK